MNNIKHLVKGQIHMCTAPCMGTCFPHRGCWDNVPMPMPLAVWFSDALCRGRQVPHTCHAYSVRSSHFLGVSIAQEKRLNPPAMKKLEMSPERARALVLGAVETRNHSIFFRGCMKNGSSLFPTVCTNKEFDRHSAGFYLQYRQIRQIL